MNAENSQKQFLLVLCLPVCHILVWFDIVLPMCAFWNGFD